MYTAVQSLNITSLAKDCLLRSTGVTTDEPLLAMYVTRTRIKLGQHWWFYVICFSHSEGSGVIGCWGAPTKHHLSVLWRTLVGNPSCHYYINDTTHKATPCAHILYDICIYMTSITYDSIIYVNILDTEYWGTKSNCMIVCTCLYIHTYCLIKL